MLTIHIVVSVGLLGDSAGFLAVAIRRAMSDDPAFADASLDLLGTFALFFGIPLSFLALLTGDRPRPRHAVGRVPPPVGRRSSWSSP